LIAAAFCVFAVAGLLCAGATTSAFAAAHKPATAEKYGGKKQAAATSKKKESAKRSKTKAVSKRDLPNPEPRTPTDKQECIAVAQAFYVEAGAISRRVKQSIPQGFTRVISKLNELCGEEEFDLARTSIDWMDSCLKDFARDQKAGVCSTSEALVCAVDPRAKACVATERLAEQ
jgi:hypothetical protein